MSKIWIPWLMENGERQARIIVPLDRECHTLKDVQNFFHTLPVRYPKLVGAHIEFEEVEDTRPVSVVVPFARRDT